VLDAVPGSFDSTDGSLNAKNVPLGRRRTSTITLSTIDTARNDLTNPTEPQTKNETTSMDPGHILSYIVTALGLTSIA
jgi:hypothetical protein